MNPIDEDIKSGQFHNLYLICGTENYMKKQYRDKLIHSLKVEGDTMNFTRFEGEKTDVKALISFADTMPFFADRRVVLCENTGLFKKTDEDFTEYLSSIPETAVLVFVERETDGRSKALKKAKQVGIVSEMTLPNDKTLMVWMIKRVENSGKKMTQAAWNEFLSRTRSDTKKKAEQSGDTMFRMDREMEKLLAYTNDREVIDITDVQEICVGQLEAKVFDMIGALAEKNSKRMMLLYHDLLLAKTPPMQIFAILVRQFRQMLLVREMHKNHMGQEEIAKAAGIPGFAVAKNLSQSKRFSTDMMRSLLSEAESYEKKVKTGLLNDQMAVELLMVKYVGR